MAIRWQIVMAKLPDGGQKNVLIYLGVDIRSAMPTKLVKSAVGLKPLQQHFRRTFGWVVFMVHRSKITCTQSTRRTTLYILNEYKTRKLNLRTITYVTTSCTPVDK